MAANKTEITSSQKVRVLLETTTLTQTEIADKAGCSTHLVGKIQKTEKISETKHELEMCKQENGRRIDDV